MNGAPAEKGQRTSERITIAYVDHTGRWGGGEIALHRFLCALDKSVFHPVVILAEGGPLADKLKKDGIETIILPLAASIRERRKDTLGTLGMTLGTLVGGPTLWQYASRVAQVLREKNASILHCNSLKADIYGVIAGKMVGIPTLWHIRDHITTAYLPTVAVRTVRLLAKHLPDRVIANSNSTLEALLAGMSPGEKATSVAQRYRMVYDCVDSPFLTLPEPPFQSQWASERPIRIGILGRVARWKGQDVFLAAATRLQQMVECGELPGVPPLRFLIGGVPLFGEQDYEEEIRDQAARTLPAENVEWCGNVTDVPTFLSGLDILIHASRTPEPFGQVVVEGMAAGLPVIATNGGGVPEIISDGSTGLLVPMGDANALAEAVRRLLLDPALAAKIAKAGYDEARARFTPRSTARGIENVYATLTGRVLEPLPSN